MQLKKRYTINTREPDKVIDKMISPIPDYPDNLLIQQLHQDLILRCQSMQ